MLLVFKIHTPLTEIRVWGKKLSLRLTTVSDAVFGGKFIGSKGFKIVTVAVFELEPIFDSYSTAYMYLTLLKKKTVLTGFFYR